MESIQSNFGAFYFVPGALIFYTIVFCMLSVSFTYVEYPKGR